MIDYSIYQSPFSYRYSSDRIRKIWSEHDTRLYWRYLWFVLAKVQKDYGLVSPEELKDIQEHFIYVDMEKSLDAEKETHHDLVAELKVFVEQCAIGGRIIHLGATSMDIKDNTEVLLMRDSLDLIEKKLKSLLEVFAKKIIETKNLVCIGYTHLQIAEPTTIGYRLSFYAQDLLECYKRLLNLETNLKAKGFGGAVGTSVSFVNLLGDKYPEFEKQLKEELNIDFFEIASQTYPRLQDFQVISELAGICGILSKFAFDTRILQSFGEVSEEFGKNQTGSSAMPAKRNPINAEKICSLAREISVYPKIMWDNYANSLLERTMDDSANRRSIIPESFFITDEILESSIKLLNGLTFNLLVIKENLDKFINYEGLLNELVKRGASRDEMYDLLNKKDYYNDKIEEYISDDEISDILFNTWDIGIASTRAEVFAQRILEEIK